MKRRTIAVAVLPAALTLGFLWWAHDGCSKETAQAPAARQEFQGWPRADVVLLISGQQHGYIEPCGCTGLANQKGGLMRRDTLLQSLVGRGWNVVPIDAGNQVRRIGAQAAIKYQFTIDGLRRMNYQAVGFGPDDLRLPVDQVLVAVTASMDEQGQSDIFVCANANPFGFVPAQRVIESAGLRIGVTGVLGARAQQAVAQPEIETRPAAEALRDAVAQLKQQRCHFVVCMAQASDKECHELAKKVPGIDLMVAADGVGEPRFQPEVIAGTKTALIQAGAKGMYVGAVGLFRQGRPAMRYQRLALDARYQDSPRISELFVAYQDVLKSQGLSGLGLKPVAHVQGQFVGSETCGECHTRAYEKWLETPHHHATASISEPTERSHIPRHFDPECLSCHVTGWNPQAFFPYETGYVDLEKSVAMHGSGCENCHGPGHAHVAAERGDTDASEEDLLKLRTQMRLELSKAEQRCIECHDLDNSPDFHREGAFEKYWQAVAHPWSD
jgi:hypothetical protein